MNNFLRNIFACSTCRVVQNKLDIYDKNVEQLERTAEEAVDASREANKNYKEVKFIYMNFIDLFLITYFLYL